MSQKYNDYLKTDYWKAVSDAIKKRDGYRCRLCNSQHDLAAHHRTYEHRGRELDFLDDLTCLCRRCHDIFHGKNTPAETPAPVLLPITTRKERRLMRQNTLAGLTNMIPHTEADIDALLPDGELITLSRPLLDRCRANGAFTSATVDALGIRGNMSRGWVDRLAGTIIPRAQFREAIRGKFFYAKKCFRVSQADGKSP